MTRLKLKKLPGKLASTRPTVWKGQLQLFLRVVGYLELGRADVLDLNCCGPVNVAFIAIKTHVALHMKLVFGELAVLDPEFHRTLGIGDGGRVVAGSGPSKGEQRFGAVHGQITSPSIAVLFKLFGFVGQIRGFHGRSFESLQPAREELAPIKPAVAIVLAQLRQ